MESGLVTPPSAGSHTYQAHRIVLAAAIPYFRQGCGSVFILYESGSGSILG
jgi:hypothetical protein